MKLMMFALLVVMASCKDREDSLKLLKGHEWQLKAMHTDGKTVKNPEQLPVLLFSDSTAVYGSAGCNRFFGKYTADAQGNMTIRPGGSTMMFCPDMEFEDQYLKALPQVRNFAVTGQELTLKGEDGKLKLVYTLMDTTKKVGVAKDAHGCNSAAGYTWSELRQDCIRIFEEGIKLVAVAGQDTTMAAFVIFSTDSLQAEAFIPGQTKHPILQRRQLPSGGYAWNQEDDDTFNVRQVDGLWIIEQRGNKLYSQTK